MTPVEPGVDFEWLGQGLLARSRELDAHPMPSATTPSVAQNARSGGGQKHILVVTRESALSASNLCEEEAAGGSELPGSRLELRALLKNSADSSIPSPNAYPFGYCKTNETI